jgi:hypothetical protein
LKTKPVALKLEKNINYMGWPNCIRLYNAEVELVVATDIGLRLLRFGFIRGQNMFYISPDDKGKQGGDQWRNYGGHRLWHAPEAIPRSYSPDNDPVIFTFDEHTLKISQAKEAGTGMVKEMEISLSPDKNQLRVVHRLINQNLWPVKLSAWALSVMGAGGEAIIPQEPYGAGDDFLLPVRSMALWSYTDMNDPRWTWGKKFIRARQDPALPSEQKIGVLNKQGWVAYQLGEDMLIKLFAFDPDAEYPDFQSNQEIYINEKFLEVETLGPYQNITPGGKTEHTEYWFLTKGTVSEKEESIEQNILPLVSGLRKGLLKSGITI